MPTRRSSSSSAERVHAYRRRDTVSRAVARRRRARRNPVAGAEAVRLRRRVGVPVADPQGRWLFRACRGHPGVRLDRSPGDDGRRPARPRPCRGHRRAGRLRADQTLATPPAKSRPAARRCSSATCTPRTRPNHSTRTDISAPVIWPAGSTTTISSSPGRAKDIIIRNGENIAPKEIEDILIGHPGVAEIAIVGLPDARTGERACAVIVPAGQPAARRAEPSRIPAVRTVSPCSKRPSRWSSGRRYRETTPARCSSTRFKRP